MTRGVGMSLGLPPFTKAVKWLVVGNIAIFVGMLLLKVLVPSLWLELFSVFSLMPVAVTHGAIWQLVTYSFLHSGVGHVLFNMLALWMFGAQFEQDWGTRKFLEYYFWCVVGASITTITVGYIGLWLVQMSPATPLFGTMASVLRSQTVGASGGVYGILIAFGMFYGNRQVMIFPLPFLIRAKVMVTVWILLAVVGALGSQGGVANFAHLGGALFGWLYLRFLPGRGLQFTASEGYYGLRNRYYRWKRRRAAKKFEVYMSQHKREDYFDEYGNFRPSNPRNDNDKEKKDPWVN